MLHLISPQNLEVSDTQVNVFCESLASRQPVTASSQGPTPSNDIRQAIIVYPELLSHMLTPQIHPIFQVS